MNPKRMLPPQSEAGRLRILFCSIALMSLIALGACREETAGDKVEDAGDKIEDVTDELGDAVDEISDEVKDVGDEIDDATKKQ